MSTSHSGDRLGAAGSGRCLPYQYTFMRRCCLWGCLQVHGCEVSEFMNHWRRRMYLFEINLMPAYMSVSLRTSSLRKTIAGSTYNSSMVSCGGSGSSRPRPIISQVKVLSTLGTPIGILPLKLKSSTAPVWGDSGLKCHRSASRPFGIPIEGSVTLKLAAGGAARWLGLVDTLSTLMVKVLVASVVGAGTSCVLSNVSTCSVSDVSKGRKKYRTKPNGMRYDIYSVRTTEEGGYRLRRSSRAFT